MCHARKLLWILCLGPHGGVGSHGVAGAGPALTSAQLRTRAWSVIRVVLAGATGWAGSALARGIAKVDDLALVGAVSRQSAGRNLREVLAEPALDCPVFATADEAVRVGCDVFVEYTKPGTAKHNVLTALAAGAN